MKVSIVIPFHNGRDNTLRWTVQSVFRQTHKFYEIFIVDDGSTDEKLLWLSRCLETEYGVRIVTQANQGPAVARNFGASHATGDALLFLDSDDWIEPTFLEKTISKMKADVGIVLTDMHVFEEDRDSVVLAKNYGLKSLLQKNEIPNTSLIKKEVFDEVGGYKWDVYEDWNLWIDILKRGWITATVSEPLMHYRSRPAGNRVNTLKLSHDILISNMRKLHPELRWP